MYSSVVFSTFTLLCIYYHSSIPRTIHHEWNYFAGIQNLFSFKHSNMSLKRTSRQMRTIKTVKSEIIRNGYYRMNIAFDNSTLHSCIFPLFQLYNYSLATMPRRSSLITVCWTLFLSFSKDLWFLFPCKLNLGSENEYH